MILLAGKAEQPVARCKSGDVGLIHPADGEGGSNAFVAALHGVGILGVIACVSHFLILYVLW